MGYCTTEIDVKKGLRLAVGGEVVSASKEDYFHFFSAWRLSVIRADIKDDNNTIFFTLENDDFVEYEIL